MPYGSADDVAQKSGTSLRCVRAQVQGEDPLTVKVAVEGLATMSREGAILALDELLEPAGLAVIARPGESRDASGLLTANAALLVGLGDVEAVLGAGLADGTMSPQETVQLVAALTESRVRIDAFLRALGVAR